MNQLRDRCLKLIYRDIASTFQEVLDKDDSVVIFMRNLQALATETSPELMKPFRFRGEIGYEIF